MALKATPKEEPYKYL